MDKKFMELEEVNSASVDFLDNATAAVDRGFAVIPLLPGQKDPDFRLVGKINNETGTGGACRRTRDRDTLTQWAEASPHANVGVCSDETITILESDDEAQFRQLVRDVSLRMFGEARDLPATLTSQARENRPHFFYAATPTTNGVEGAPGIQGLFEWRRENQYVVGPGSLHPTGVRYKIVKDVPIAPMPDWLVEVLLEIRKAHRGERSGASSFVKVGPAAIARDALLNKYMLDPEAMLNDSSFEIYVGAGERHYFLQSMAGLLHDGEREEEELCDILKRMRDQYCEAGKGDYEVESLARWTIKKAPCDIEPNYPPMIVKGIIYRDQDAYEAALNVWRADWRSMFHSRAEFENAEELGWLIKDFIQNGNVTLIGASPGSMKTYVGLLLARALITGQALFGKLAVERQPDHVVYLIPEASVVSLKKRLRVLGLMPFVGTKLFIATLNTEHEIMLTDERLAEACRDAVVVLDTMIRFSEGDENSSSDLKKLSKQIFRLVQAGAQSVIGMHHAGKAFVSAKDITQENILRGSTEFAAMAATIWGIGKVNDELSQIFLKCCKDRDMETKPPEFVLQGRYRDGRGEIKSYIDETGDFLLLHYPAPEGFFMSAMQSKRGKRGGRQQKKYPLVVIDKVLELNKDGKSQREIVEAMGKQVSKRGVSKIIDADMDELQELIA